MRSPLRERALDPIDRLVHVGELERIVKMVERRIEEPVAPLGDRRARAGTAAARSIGMHAERGASAGACSSSHGRCCQRRDFIKCSQLRSRLKAVGEPIFTIRPRRRCRIDERLPSSPIWRNFS